MLLHLAILLLAEAPAERIRVEWLAPEGCPDRAALTSRLEDSVAAGRTFTASVRIDEPGEPGKPWRAVVLTSLGDGQRSRLVEAPDCKTVTEAAVLVITLAATSLAQSEPTAGAIAPASLPPAQPETTPDEPVAARAAVNQRLELEEPKQFHVLVLPLVGANVGVLPVPGVSIGLGVVLGHGPLRGEISVSQWLDSETPGAGRGARFSLTSVKLTGCWLLEPRRGLHVGPCFGAEAGRITAEGQRITTPAKNGTAWFAGLVGATLGFDLAHSVHPWVSVEAGANFLRPAFVISTPTGDDFVHRVAPIVGRVTVGLEFTIP